MQVVGYSFVLNMQILVLKRLHIVTSWLFTMCVYLNRDQNLLISFHYLLFVCCDFDRTLNTSLIAEADKPMNLFIEGQVKQRKPVRSCIITACTTITIII